MLSSCLIRSDFQTTSSSLRAAFVLPDTLPNFTVTLDFSGLVLEWRQTVGRVNQAMNQQEFEFMNDLARAFERRYRDTRSRNRCLSIESRYMGEEVYPHEPEIGLRYGEDAMFLTLQAWAKVDAPQQEAVRISFGIGAKSQAAYEERLQAEIRRRGEKPLHSLTDLGLAAWYGAIRQAAGDDFDLLFEKV